MSDGSTVRRHRRRGGGFVNRRVRDLIPLAASAALAGTAPAVAAATAAAAYPMEIAGWRAAPPLSWAGGTRASLRFARYEGMPTGTMTVDSAVAMSDAARFADGTIDFDIKPLGYDDAGIIFRRTADGDGEFLYLRANPDCPAADDCIQYAPITHGLMQWDIYADHQGPAPITPIGWNHVRLVVGGTRMLVFLNQRSEPALVVPKLQGLDADGGIAFKGAATFANLLIHPGAVPGLDGVHEPPPAAGTVLSWMAAPPVPASDVDRPADADAVPAAGAWTPIPVEPSGLVNLSRAFGGGPAPPIMRGWLRTTIDAAAPGRRELQLGWARQLTVFLNGKRVFFGSNPYRPVERRLSPDGRLEPDDATIPLDLRRGRNELVLAVGNGWITGDGRRVGSFYGWAAEAHFLDPTGLTLAAAPTPR